jgi:hypothetical protein
MLFKSFKKKDSLFLSPKCNGEESFLGQVILWWRNFSLDPPIMTIFWSLRIYHIAIKIIACHFSPTPRTAPIVERPTNMKPTRMGGWEVKSLQR